MNRKNLFVANNQNSISEIFQLNISRSFLKWIFYAIWFYAFQASVDAFSFSYSKLVHANLSVGIVALLLHCIGNLLAYVAALFMASVTKLSRAHGSDARTGDFKSRGCRIECAAAKNINFQGLFLLFLF